MIEIIVINHDYLRLVMINWDSSKKSNKLYALIL